MSEPTQDLTVVADGLALLTSMYARQPNICAMLTAILSVRQELENVLWAVYVGHRLRTAPLYALPLADSVFDDIGALVGQARGGLSDAQYQAVLFLRVAVKNSTGRITDWSQFASILLQTSPGVTVAFYEGTAAFVFSVFDLTLPPLVIAQTLSHAVPNGVRAVFDFSSWPDGNDFEWCAADGTGGQGPWADAAGAIGGLLVASIGIT